MTLKEQIKPAALVWRNEEPFSQVYADVYFSRGDGLEESRSVFLAGNQLAERWPALNRFTLAETGFGTGLNFLVAAERWLATAPAGAVLDYIAVEKHPLAISDLQRALKTWPALDRLTGELIDHYPELVPGFHCLRLFGGKVRLLLLFGDAVDMLGELQASVDGWFLDGFAPQKNPEMWSPALFREISRLSHEGTTAATFTVAGVVRRGLQQNGFRVEKVPGFGAKKQNLTAVYQQPQRWKNPQPWFAPARTPHSGQKSAIVIGGGIAGLASTYSLWQRGWKVQLIERRAHVAEQASGNLAGLVMPRLTADMNRDGQFYLNAFLQTVAWLSELKAGDPSIPWHQTGVIQLADENWRNKIADLSFPDSIIQTLTETQANEHSGVPVDEAALFYPRAGFLQPKLLCQKLLRMMAGEIRFCHSVDALSLSYEQKNWRVSGSDGVLAEAPAVIIANSYDAMQFSQCEFLPLQKTRGQLCYVNASSAAMEPRMPVCFQGYLIPPVDGQLCIGASYDRHEQSDVVNEKIQQQLLQQLQRTLPELAVDTVQAPKGRVSFRAGTPDHLPLVGAIPDAARFCKQFAGLREGKTARYFADAEYLPGLYVNVGHGSRGLVSSWPAAELIAAQLNHEPLPLPTSLVQALHPARFLVRTLRKG